jgi:hypothetical protein
MTVRPFWMNVCVVQAAYAAVAVVARARAARNRFISSSCAGIGAMEKY